MTRKAIQDPKRIVFPRVKPSGGIDIHSDSGYRKLTGEEDDDTKGYGIRGRKPPEAWTRDWGEIRYAPVTPRRLWQPPITWTSVILL